MEQEDQQSSISHEIDSQLSKLDAQSVTMANSNDLSTNKISSNNENIINQAKIFLKDNNYDIQKMQQQNEFKVFTTNDITKLKNFKKNQNRHSRLEKIQNENQQDSSKLDVQHQITTQLQAYEQETNKLLCVQSQEDKLKILKSIREKLGSFAFCSFLQTLSDGQMIDGLFSLLFGMINGEPTLDHKKSLLLQACLFYDKSKVDVDLELIKAVFSEFKYMQQEQKQCLGFLYLLYENNSAAFSELNLQQVIELENDLQFLPIQLSNFLKQFMQSFVRPYFPATLMCLTPPIINEIKEKEGKAFFYDVPQDFMIEHIEILVYSFEPNIDAFDQYVSLMQSYYIQFHKKLRHFFFIRAMTYMSQLLKKKDIQWMSNLKKIGEYFTTLIQDVILKKETIINDSILKAALDNDSNTIQNLPDQKAAKITQKTTEQFWNYAYEHNSQNLEFKEFLDNFEFEKLDDNIQQLAKYANTPQLHTVQELCLAYTISRKKSIFSIVGIGHGKTILCNILAAHFALTTDKQIIVLNKQKNLSFRNATLFDKTLAANLNLTVGFDGQKRNQEYKVIYMCEDDFNLYLKQTKKPMEDLILIIDEADQVLFTDISTKLKDKELNQWKTKLLNYAKASAIYAFSGTITDIECECIKNAFGIEIIDYPKLNTLKPFQNILVKQNETEEKDQWLYRISEEINQKCREVPILILSSLRYEKEIIKEVKNRHSVNVNIQSLINKDAISINVALNSMNIYDEECGYPILIVDESLCRGLNVITSSKIEQKGGVYVIIAKIPTSTKVMQQAIGRTQRFIYKGQHSIIVWNAQKKNMQQQLNDADAKIDFNIRQLLQALKSERHHNEEIQNANAADDKQNEEENKNENENSYDKEINIAKDNVQNDIENNDNIENNAFVLENSISNANDSEQSDDNQDNEEEFKINTHENQSILNDSIDNNMKHKLRNHSKKLSNDNENISEVVQKSNIGKKRSQAASKSIINEDNETEDILKQQVLTRSKRQKLNDNQFSLLDSPITNNIDQVNDSEVSQARLQDEKPNHKKSKRSNDKSKLRKTQVSNDEIETNQNE